MFTRKKFRVKTLSNEHSYHNDNKHSASITQKNHEKFIIMNCDLADRFLFEKKRRE